jgi:hypothetical protein
MSAPTMWLPSRIGPTLTASADRRAGSEADFDVRRLETPVRLHIDALGRQCIAMESIKRHAMLYIIAGAPVAVSPVKLTFRMQGLGELFAAQNSIGIFKELLVTRAKRAPEPEWPVTRQELRDAIVALDGHCAGASYRQTAELIYGSEQVKKEWLGSGCALKDEIRRTRARGVRLMMGGYRQYLC